MAIIIPRRREDFFNPKTGEPTHRFIRWIELVTQQTNDITDDVAEIAPATFFSSQLQQLREELDGLPEFTIDTSGFTTDLTFITTDKAIA